MTWSQWSGADELGPHFPSSALGSMILRQGQSEHGKCTRLHQAVPCIASRHSSNGRDTLSNFRCRVYPTRGLWKDIRKESSNDMLRVTRTLVAAIAAVITALGLTLPQGKAIDTICVTAW